MKKLWMLLVAVVMLSGVAHAEPASTPTPTGTPAHITVPGAISKNPYQYQPSQNANVRTQQKLAELTAKANACLLEREQAQKRR